MTPSDCLVLIPAFNEETRILPLLQAVKTSGYPVLVVDDGSTDNTVSEIKKLNVPLILSPFNEGKGASLRKGFERFLKENYSAVILMDADGQHDPAELGLFLQALNREHLDFVIGNRLIDSKNMPFVRRMTNHFMSWILSWVSKQKIADSQCGYRAIRKDALKKLSLSTAHFEIESEMLIQASRQGMKIGSVPIRCIYEGGKSSIHPIADTIRFMKFILRAVFS